MLEEIQLNKDMYKTQQQRLQNMIDTMKTQHKNEIEKTMEMNNKNNNENVKEYKNKIKVLEENVIEKETD